MINYLRYISAKNLILDVGNCHRPYFSLNNLFLSQPLVLSALRHLAPNIAPGLDGILPLVLKECVPQLVSLLHVFQTFTVYYFPLSWKLPNIHCNTIMGDFSSPSTYRSVNFSLMISKVTATRGKSPLPIEHRLIVNVVRFSSWLFYCTFPFSS